MAHFCQSPMTGVGPFADSPERLRPGGGPAILETSESNRCPLGRDPRPAAGRAEPDNLADWIEAQAATFKSQETQAGQLDGRNHAGTGRHGAVPGC